MLLKHKIACDCYGDCAMMSGDHHGKDCDNGVQSNYDYNWEDNFDYFKYYIYILILLLLQSCLKV
jgi:hypothetical protein